MNRATYDDELMALATAAYDRHRVELTSLSLAEVVAFLKRAMKDRLQDQITSLDEGLVDPTLEQVARERAAAKSK